MADNSGILGTGGARNAAKAMSGRQRQLDALEGQSLGESTGAAVTPQEAMRASTGAAVSQGELDGLGARRQGKLATLMRMFGR